MSGRLEREYFKRIYAESDDPWGFESSWYERRKQCLTMALPSKPHYRRVFEPGSASGELTRLLAARADQVVAMELMPNIVARAATRLADLENVKISVGAIPDDWPEGSFDLILLSEVAYYLARDGLEKIIELASNSLETGGELVAVHYLGETDYPLTGREVHEFLETSSGLQVIATYEERDFCALVLKK